MVLHKIFSQCFKKDFKKEVAKVSLNGDVSEVQQNVTFRYFNGTMDHQTFTNWSNETWNVTLGTYSFDKNPFIGFFANVNVWDRTMETKELSQRTLCNLTVTNEKGSVVNNSFNFDITGNLVQRKFFEESDTICNKNNTRTNAFIPISELTRDESEDLCRKFGEDVPIAGNFEDKEDFDNFFEGLHKNKRFVEECSYFDNGRLRTWIPYKAQCCMWAFFYFCLFAKTSDPNQL